MEKSKKYKQYINSPEWESKRHERMIIDGFKCVMCGRPSNTCKTMNVHHVTYKNLGHEDVYAELVTLCPPCHIKIHRYYDRIKRKD